MNLLHIAQGWYQYRQGNYDVRKRMLSRLRACDECPHKVQTDGAGKVISSVLGNSKENAFSCGLCKCPLGAKASLARDTCETGAWKELS